MEIRPILSTLRRHKITATLIVFEIALSCAILCNALFLIVQRATAVTQPSGISEEVLLRIRVSGIGPQEDADARTHEDLAALRGIPGVAAASMVNQLPFSLGASNADIGRLPNQDQPTLNAALYQGNDDLLDTMGLRLVAGRDFLPEEYLQATELRKRSDFNGIHSQAIISAETARQLFPDGDAIGKQIYMGHVPLTVIGIVEALRRPRAEDGNWTHAIVLPIRNNYVTGSDYLVRVNDPARRDEVLAGAVSALEQVAANRLILQQRSYAEIRKDYFRNDIDMIGLLAIVSIALLVVTALGIVGLASFWVQQRTKQIGVRRALGATKGQILRYFQTENFLLTSIGIMIGMLLAYALNLLLMNHYAIPRLPLLYLPVGAATLWLLGQLAVLAPARRAADIPPATATRSI